MNRTGRCWLAVSVLALSGAVACGQSGRSAAKVEPSAAPAGPTLDCGGRVAGVWKPVPLTAASRKNPR